MFTVRENPKAYIKVNINPINNHLLALESIEHWSGSTTYLLSHFYQEILYTIFYKKATNI